MTRFVKALHIGLFLAGLLATATAIRHLDAVPFWGFTRTKVAHLANGALADYDTLFVGSSRIHSGIVPEEFDARMNEHGAPTRSFNLGHRGMRPHDFDTVIDWLLANRPPTLKRVFVEVYSFNQSIRDGNWMSGFQVECHAPAHWWSRMQSNWMHRRDTWEKLRVFGYITSHTLANFFRIGQVPRIAKDLLAQSSDRPYSPRRAVPARGFLELSPENPPSKARLRKHQKFRDNPAAAEKIRRARAKTLCTEKMAGGFNLNAFRDRDARLRAAGLEVIYLVLPQFSYGFFGRDGVGELTDEVTLLLLDSPIEHPDLYDHALWFDDNHLMRPGAIVQTRKVADLYHAAKK